MNKELNGPWQLEPKSFYIFLIPKWKMQSEKKMESCGRSSLSSVIASFHRHSRSDLLFPSLKFHLKRRLSLSIASFSSQIPLSDKVNPLPRGAGEGVKEDARTKLLQVVLVSPQVCLAFGLSMDNLELLSFQTRGSLNLLDRFLGIQVALQEHVRRQLLGCI